MSNKLGRVAQWLRDMNGKFTSSNLTVNTLNLTKPQTKPQPHSSKITVTQPLSADVFLVARPM